MLAGFAAVWLWIVALPSAFLDREYPIWQAKLRLLDTCDLGSILVVGDSRAAADIIPALLPGRASNLAIGGAQPVESYFAVKRALQCPNPPGRVVISHSMGHFFLPDTFWTRSARFRIPGLPRSRGRLRDLGPPRRLLGLRRRNRRIAAQRPQLDVRRAGSRRSISRASSKESCSRATGTTGRFSSARSTTAATISGAPPPGRTL